MSQGPPTSYGLARTWADWAAPEEDVFPMAVPLPTFPVKPPIPPPDNTLASDLDVLLHSEALSDCHVLVGDRRFMVHKFILAARSPLLRSRLEMTMENDAWLPLVIHVSECSADTFESVLRCMYTDVLHSEVEPASTLVQACQTFQMSAIPPTPSLANDIGAFVNSNCFSDVVFVFETQQRFHAHKAILCARSNYFRELLEGRLKTLGYLEMEIEVKDVLPAVFNLVLTFMYTDKLNLAGTSDLLWPILEVAQFYKVPRLEHEVESIIASSLTVHNLYSNWGLAQVTQSKRLVQECAEFCQAHSAEVLTTEEFEGFGQVDTPSSSGDTMTPRPPFPSSELSQETEKMARKRFSAQLETHVSMYVNPVKKLNVLMDIVTLMFNSDRSTLFLHDVTTDELCAPIAQKALNVVIRLPVNKGIVGAVFQKGEAINTEDAYSDPRFHAEIDMQTGFTTKCVLCVPIRFKDGKIVGAIQTINKAAGVFTQEDEKLLALIAQVIAAVLERVLESTGGQSTLSDFLKPSLPAEEEEEEVVVKEEDRMRRLRLTIDLRSLTRTGSSEELGSREHQQQQQQQQTESSLSSDLGMWVNSKVLSDVAFVVEGTRFPAHKFILCVRCPYLRGLFLGDLNMYSQLNTEIDIKGLSPSVFATILRFIYTDRADLTPESVWHVLEAAQFYGLAKLQRFSEECLAKSLTVDTVCPLWFFAHQFKAWSLLAKAEHYFARHFNEVVTTQGFLRYGPQIMHAINTKRSTATHEPTVYEVVRSLSQSDMQGRHPRTISREVEQAPQPIDKLNILMDLIRQSIGNPMDHLHVLLEIVSVLFNAERSTLFLYDDMTDELVAPIAQGESVAMVRCPASSGIAGSVFQTRTSVSIPDAYNDPRFHREVDAKTGFVTRCILASPVLLEDDTCVGVIEVLNKREGTFNDEDREFLSLISQLASVVIQRTINEARVGSSTHPVPTASSSTSLTTETTEPRPSVPVSISHPKPKPVEFVFEEDGVAKRCSRRKVPGAGEKRRRKQNFPVFHFRVPKASTSASASM